MRRRKKKKRKGKGRMVWLVSVRGAEFAVELLSVSGSGGSGGGVYSVREYCVTG